MHFLKFNPNIQEVNFHVPAEANIIRIMSFFPLSTKEITTSTCSHEFQQEWQQEKMNHNMETNANVLIATVICLCYGYWPVILVYRTQYSSHHVCFREHHPITNSRSKLLCLSRRRFDTGQYSLTVTADTAPRKGCLRMIKK